MFKHDFPKILILVFKLMYTAKVWKLLMNKFYTSTVLYNSCGKSSGYNFKDYIFIIKVLLYTFKYVTCLQNCDQQV